MVHSDPIADLLTRIRNAVRTKKPSLSVPHSNLKSNLVQCLHSLGLIRSYTIEALDEVKKVITIKLKYVNGESVFSNLERKSKPGRRQYASSQARFYGRPQHSIVVLTTNKGIMTLEAAKSMNVGGEVLCTIW